MKDIKFMDVNYILEIISEYQKEYVKSSKELNEEIKYSNNDVYDILDELVDIIIEATTIED